MLVLPEADAADLRRRFLALARSQEGVVSRAQAREHGVTRHVVRSQVRGRRWQLLGPRVVVLHTGPMSSRQHWWAAVLHAGPRSALFGLSALQAEGLQGYEPAGVHVVVPHGSQVPHLPGLRVVEARHLIDCIHPSRRPPRTRRERAVVDAAADAPDGLRACAILAAAVQQGLVRVTDVQEELDRRRNVPRRAQLAAVLADIAVGAQSLGELDALRLCRRFGLPPPTCQVRVEQHGKHRYLDLQWKRYRLTVEIDGGHHREVSTWWADMDRQNEVVLAAEGVVLRFPATVVRLFPERVADQVRRALESLGWSG